MSKLIYHRPGAGAETSPFDEAILEAAKQGGVKIISPYIGLSYLRRIISIAGDWVLISDIEAWLSSLSTRARPATWLFIRENLDRIHHCPAIHAKTVIGESLAVMGSANLTSAGILARTEMAIVIDDPGQVEEMNAWFDDIWAQTDSPLVDEASAYVQWLDEEARASTFRKTKPLTSTHEGVKARLAHLVDKPSADGTNPLDLAGVAKELVIESQEQHLSASQFVSSFIDRHISQGFSLKKLFKVASEQDVGLPQRDVYLALLGFTANHPRSVFAAGTVNRLLLINGRFVGTIPELIYPSIANFDAYLALVIHRLDFEEERELLSSTEIERLTHIPAGEQKQLLFSLIETGLVEQVDDHEPMYVLVEDFDWPSRWVAFKVATQQWESRMVVEHDSGVPKESSPHSLGSTSPQGAGYQPVISEGLELPIKGTTKEEASVHIVPPPIKKPVEAKPAKVPQPTSVPAAKVEVAKVAQEPKPTQTVHEPASREEQAETRAVLKPAEPCPAVTDPQAPFVEEEVWVDPLSEPPVTLVGRADNIYRILLGVIRRNGPFFSDARNVGAIAGKLDAAREPSGFVSRLLKGELDGPPILFKLVRRGGGTRVGLAEKWQEAFRSFPFASKAFMDLPAGLQHALAAPDAEYEVPEEGRPKTSNPIPADTTELQHMADRVYTQLVKMLADRRTGHVEAQSLAEVGKNIGTAIGITGVNAFQVLNNELTEVPRVFGFRYIKVKRKRVTCKVSLLVKPEEIQQVLPQTAYALQKLPNVLIDFLTEPDLPKAKVDHGNTLSLKAVHRTVQVSDRNGRVKTVDVTVVKNKRIKRPRTTKALDTV